MEDPKVPKAFEARVSEVFEAIGSGNIQRLDRLLASDRRLVDAANAEYRCKPLLWAAMYGFNQRSKGREAVVDLLVRYGARVDIFAASFLGISDLAQRFIRRDPGLAAAADEFGWTALHYVSEAGYLELARLLLGAGANPDAETPDGRRPIDLAAHPGPWKPRPAAEIISLLRAHGATVGIHLAASIGDDGEIGRLLDGDSSLMDAQDREGASPLFHAAKNLQGACVSLLIGRGCNVNARRADGQTAVSAAVGHIWDRGGPEVVALLVGAGAELDLYEAARLGDGKRIRKILSLSPLHPARIHESRWGDSALGAAAKHGHTEAGRLLIDAGYEADLHAAAGLGLVDEARRLIEEDRGRLGETQDDGQSVMHRAAEAGQAEMVRLLAECGAEIDARADWGGAPLFCVSAPHGREPRPGDADVARALIDCGADVNGPGGRGGTPLHGASFRNNVFVARVLLERGADASLADERGETPLDVARSLGHSEIVSLLKSRVL